MTQVVQEPGEDVTQVESRETPKRGSRTWRKDPEWRAATRAYRKDAFTIWRILTANRLRALAPLLVGVAAVAIALLIAVLVRVFVGGE